MQMNSFMAPWDMVAEPDEQFYLAQYWHWLQPVIRRLSADARIFDVGCGQGRLTLPLAAVFPQASIVGVDVSDEALAAAKRYVVEQGIRNVELYGADAVAFLSKQPDQSVDLVLFLEVAQWMEHYREALAQIARVLKPGGTLVASLRSQYNQLLREVQERRLEGARLARDARSGQVGDGPVRFSWHTVEDLHMLLADLGLEIEGLYAIGPLSGTHTDPLAAIARPSRLPEETRAELLQLELSLAEQYAGQGRYIAAVATKR
jgi:tRNA G46 methylase TrmB